MARGSIILLGGALLRVILFLWEFDEVFGFRKEIVTPNTDLKRVTEGLFLMRLGQSPYAGDSFHQPPLILALFYPLQDLKLVVRGLFILQDLVMAWALLQIAIMWQNKVKLEISALKKKNDGIINEEDKHKILLRQNLPEIAAFLYLFNPFTVFNCVGMSTITFNNLAVILSLYFALKGNQTLTTFTLAVASYLTVYPITLLFPLTVFLKKPLLSNAILTFFWTGGLLLLSYLMFHSWEFLADTYGFNMLVSDLTPNIGLFWYFFTEVFKHYRAFYLFAYQYHAFIYAIPLYFRISHHPMFFFWMSVAIMACFKSYPVVGDLALQMAILPLIFDSIRGTFQTRNILMMKDNRYGIIMLIALPFVTVLAPIFWVMWIYHGTGNANFYYAINLVTTMGQVWFMTNSLSVVLKNDYFEKKKVKQEVERLKQGTSKLADETKKE